MENLTLQASRQWYKIEQDSKGNIERYNAKPVAKGFTQKEGLGYNETFSPISKIESLRLIWQWLHSLI